MSRVKIQLFHQNDARDETKLIRTIWVERDTNKKLTGKQAKQILAKEFPQFVKSYGILITKSEESWRASRTIKPTEECDYHFIWERAVITEDEEN